jgi:hypothetical protein
LARIGGLHGRGDWKANGTGEIAAEKTRPSKSRNWREGHRLDSRQRESSINQLLTPDIKASPAPSGRRKCANTRSIFDFSVENAKIQDCMAEKGGFEPKISPVVPQTADIS